MSHHDRAMSFSGAVGLLFGGSLLASLAASTAVPFLATVGSAFFGLVFFNALETKRKD